MQEDENIQEHAMYYLSMFLIDAKISNSHVEKLALVTVTQPKGSDTKWFFARHMWSPT